MGYDWGCISLSFMFLSFLEFLLSICFLLSLFFLLLLSMVPMQRIPQIPQIQHGFTWRLFYCAGNWTFLLLSFYSVFVTLLQRNGRGIWYLLDYGSLLHIWLIDGNQQRPREYSYIMRQTCILQSWDCYFCCPLLWSSDILTSHNESCSRSQIFS